MELFIAIIGVVTIAVAVLVKVIGLPDQIRKNYKRKSTEGLSTVFVLMGLLSYVLWTLYGALKHDWVVVWGQGVGMVAMGIIAWQVCGFIERRRNLMTTIFDEIRSIQ